MIPEGLVWLEGEPLARHTALRTGGPCEVLAIAHDLDALAAATGALKERSGSPLVLGAGTRLAFRDGPYERAVLRLGQSFREVSVQGGLVEVGAACPCPALAWRLVQAERTGLEGLARVPGSVGAALALDEGSIRERLTQVQIWSRGGARWVAPPKGCGSKLILAARFELPSAPGAQILERTRRALRGARSLPSWYRPPKRGQAGVELVRVGVAGVRLRGASIPEVAPEMLINAGRGSAADLQLLHRTALDRVARMRGVELKSAISFLGRA
ncbi:MAG: FAD-binding protein [Deltaproteobacteria bacterium]|nr:MAG: FAD-binding protein [Deltaproteobacteria bacterium]